MKSVKTGNEFELLGYVANYTNLRVSEVENVLYYTAKYIETKEKQNTNKEEANIETIAKELMKLSKKDQRRTGVIL